MKKNIFLTFVLIVAFVSCNSDKTKKQEEVSEEKKEENPSIMGAWEMTGYLNYSGNGSVDTIKSSNKFMQMKMFSETKYMWNRYTSYHPSEWFGSGDYTFKDGILIEHTEFGSQALNTVLEKDSIHRLSIDFIDKDSYMQTEKDSLGNPIYAEIYHRVR